MTTKLEFFEHNTGWNVIAYDDGLGFYEIARLEETKGEGWVLFDTYASCTLKQLDQIRHKLANLEQLRINKQAMKRPATKEKSNG